MDKATAEKMVIELIYAYQKFYTTPAHESNTAVENYVNAKLKIIEALTQPPAVIPEAPTCPVCLSIRLVVTCVDCEVDLSEHIGCLWDRKSLHDTQITQRKPPDPLHNKSAEWQAGYQWGLSGAAEAQEKDADTT